MSFSSSVARWASSVAAAGLVLSLVGCSPEATTPAGKPREQAGSSSGGSARKGRAEIPEPAPADEDKKGDAKASDEKPADEKPADEKPQE